MSDVDASWNGATLAERLAHVRTQQHASSSPESAADDALAPWARVCALGNTDALRRRLSWDGIAIATARAAMAAQAPADFPVAAWVSRIDELAADARACAARLDAPELEAVLAIVGHELPFVEAWLPVLRAARRRLALALSDSREWLSDEAMAALEAHLLRELARFGELALLEDFQLAESPGYQLYIQRLLGSRYAEVLRALPVLARRAMLLADQWVGQTAALVRRLRDDRPAIDVAFGAAAGRVQRITTGLSDRHEGGGRVVSLTFASGLRLAYKPRDVRLERAFNDWLHWLRDAGLSDAPPPLRVLDRDTYGWVEWAEYDTLATRDAVRQYFRSAGALVCLVWVLGGTDLHSENLVATAGGPVLVDTEMLLQPSTRPTRDQSRDASSDEDAPAAAADSCLASGLVSHIVFDRTGRAFDVGGLQPATARELAVEARAWVDLRSDRIRYAPEHRVHPVLRNDARLDGDVQRPEAFVDDLCAGFEATWRFLASNRATLLAADGPLATFARCRTRVLFRPSDQYAAAQYLLAAPRYQRRGLDRSLAIEIFDRVFVREVERPRLWPLVGDERQALEGLDIPRQTIPVSSVDLTATTGEVVQGFYARSGLEAMRGRLSALSSDDLARQIDQLRTALGAHDPAAVAPRAERDAEPVDDESASLIAAAERIGRAVLDRAHRGLDDGLRWPSAAGKSDLYAGGGGMAVFLAALAAVTGGEGWRDAAHRACRGIDAASDGSADASGRIGACNGLPSAAYALALIGRLLADERLIERARDTLLAVSSEAIDTDVVLDIEGGAAGALVACLAVHEVYADDRLLAIGERCLSRLAATQIRCGVDRGAWPSSDETRARPGFAHGAAGIAYALGRWAAHTGDRGVAEPVHEAWQFERRLFAESDRAWPAIRRDGGRIVMAAWCHGAPGIGLARASAPATLADAEVVGEIETAMKQTLTAPESQLDHLCCGNLGRADVALTVGLRANAPICIDAGRGLSRTVAARVLAHGRHGMRGKGFHSGAPAPELFQGLAGIGYQLLRAARPSRLPSVLTFEIAPVVGRRTKPHEEHR